MAQNDDSLPTIYLSNGSYLVYSPEDAIKLRRQRIVGQLIGCPPNNVKAGSHQVARNTLPLLLNKYEIHVIHRRRLAVFKRLKRRSNIDQEDNSKRRQSYIDELTDSARGEFYDIREKELQKRNLNVTPERLGRFDENKLRVRISVLPHYKCNIYEPDEVDIEAVDDRLSAKPDEDLDIFEDLYNRGFYVTSGMKFGCDFLAYCGDPVRYHAQFAIRLVKQRNDGIDLEAIDYNVINTIQRLCHTTCKTPLFAHRHAESRECRYWTLEDREFLGPRSTSGAFQAVEDLQLSTVLRKLPSKELAHDGPPNKMQRTEE